MDAAAGGWGLSPAKVGSQCPLFFVVSPRKDKLAAGKGDDLTLPLDPLPAPSQGCGGGDGEAQDTLCDEEICLLKFDCAGFCFLKSKAPGWREEKKIKSPLSEKVSIT